MNVEKEASGKIESSDKDSAAVRPKFGNRLLMDKDDIFFHNAWDKVEWDDEQKRHAEEMVMKNSLVRVPGEDGKKFEEDAHKFWDSFYSTHDNRFFKDRHWLFTEFPELEPSADIEKSRSIFELGCGVGNTIIPLLNYNREPNLKVYGCDFSARAIEILRTNPEFDSKRAEVFVMDATAENWDVPFPENSQDMILLIFVLSAIKPDNMQRVIKNCYRYLRPGGIILFRDYGRYDLAQLRFKSGKCLYDNCYVRGDGTLVYFFESEELRKLFCGAGFVEDEIFVDRRLQVNRIRMLKMYRVWIQAKFHKSLEE